MSLEIFQNYPASGANIYAFVRQQSTGDVWDGADLVTWVTANIADYDVALTDYGGGFYAVNFPALLTTTALYEIQIRLRAGATPALSDTILSTLTIQWTGTSVAVGSAGNQAATVSELRAALRFSGRNVGIDDLDDSTYDLTEKDLAIQDVLNDFIRRTGCTNQLDTLSISEDDTEVDFTSLDGFHPARLKGQRLWIEGKEDIHEDLGIVLEARKHRSTETGAPEESGFTDEQTLQIWPKSDDDYTLNVMWGPPLTGWTAGDAGADSTTINVPKDLAIRAVRTGGVVSLQNGGIENVPITDRSRTAYEAHVSSSSGRGSISGVVTRRSLRDQSCRRWA